MPFTHAEGPLPELRDAAELRARYAALARLPDSALEEMKSVYDALRASPEKVSLAFTVLVAAAHDFGKDDGAGLAVNPMSFRLFAGHVRQTVENDL